MDAELKAYYDNDPGFAQFVDRHGIVSATPEVRKAYRKWEYDLILDKLDEERRAAKMNALLTESEARGEAKRNMEIALIALSGVEQDRDVSHVIDTLRKFNIPDYIIEEARQQTESTNL